MVIYHIDLKKNKNKTKKKQQQQYIFKLRILRGNKNKYLKIPYLSGLVTPAK